MKDFNNFDVKGRLYSYALETGETDKGSYIRGNLIMEVAADGTTQKVDIFMSPTYSNGNTNKSFKIIESIMNGEYNTVEQNGDAAAWLDLRGQVNVNYFLTKEGDIQKSQKVQIRFINPNLKKEYLLKWKVDMIITNIEEKEADPEKGYERFLLVSGYLPNNYFKNLKEFSFQARKEGAIDFLLGLGIDKDNPRYSQVWGTIQNVGYSRVTKNAFGEDEIEELSSSKWVIEGMPAEGYDFFEVQDEFNEFYKGMEQTKDELLAEKAEVKTELEF